MSLARFISIDRKILQNRINNGTATLIEPPRDIVKQQLHSSIRAIQLEDDKLAPYLCCAECKNTFVWYKFELLNKKWVNQSGINSVKTHITDNCKRAPCSSMGSIAKHFETQHDPLARKTLAPKAKASWRKHVVHLIAQHPTVSISACAEIASSCANFAAEHAHRNNNVLCDYSIGRTYITSGEELLLYDIIYLSTDIYLSIYIFFRGAVEFIGASGKDKIKSPKFNKKVVTSPH